jgi:thiamine pyrophosphate-dependent acetolactate synthase large subunit-like protein
VLDQIRDAIHHDYGPLATQWLDEAKARRNVHRQRCLDTADKLVSGTNGKDVVLAIRQVLTEETILLVDGGNIGQWFHQ